MSRAQRAKGARGEVEVVELAKAYGFPARRNFQSGGQGGGDITGIPGCHLEVKRQERLNVWQAIAQAEAEARPTDTPVVAFRRNGNPWYAAVPLEELLALLRLREGGLPPLPARVPAAASPSPRESAA